ncbi:Major Facilitator Superfamily protein [Paenibacillus sp. UNC496MF]|uniref:MFS transporter n=1 Tax=Paenibacillus sp. UNC496MF TaxID=1502753 RepID=UPI0008F21E9F|nr:MFS transporter [Paenibacillus sp. UNC496MF]SFJ45230.1 Major Facilitator Superfamily protein [Paenibacillus sp. UNC496MF]
MFACWRSWTGAATLVAALLSLLMAPVLIDNLGLSWSSPLIVGLLALSAALTALFVFIERRAKEPIIPLRLFRHRSVVVLSCIVLILMLGIMGGIATFPFFAQNVMGLTPTAAGYLMLAFMAGAIPSSIANGFLITKVPYRNLFIACFTLPIVGFYLLTRIGLDTSVLYVIVTFFILGLGIGVLFGSDNLIVQESVDKADSGAALGTVQLFQSLGATIGLSVFGSLLARHINQGVSGIADRLPAGTANTIATGGIPKGLPHDLLIKVQTVFADAFQGIFGISFVFVIAAFAVCWFLKKEVLRKREETPGTETVGATAASAE